MRNIFVISTLIILTSLGCKKDKIVDNTTGFNSNTNALTLNVTTDKASYKPGDVVNFSADQTLPSGASIRYKSAGAIIQQGTALGKTWTWTTPNSDFTGYMVEIYGMENGQEKIYSTIAVDVSSDPSRFPRNGFLSAYGQISASQISTVMSSLNRYHINYIQFQDWEYEHQMPLAGTVASPASTWKDIANRDNYKATVQAYISSAHNYNMKALHYNLAYGALNDASAEGVLPQWYIYSDAGHATMNEDVLPMPPFKSNIYVTDPANTDWQKFIIGNTNDMYQVYGFDGWQIDQLGDRGAVYDYSGNAIDLTTTFAPFISAVKNSATSKRLVMNAVTQFGQPQIATTPVDFLYSEVYTPYDGFSDLAGIIQSNNALTNGSKQSVLAAYMDYDLASNPGYFNTPGVLMTDAVIFAFGGSHIELGEHMLGKEYFPNANLVMPADLKAAAINYYDFLTGYENILRDGGAFNTPAIIAGDNKLTLNNWPPQLGQVSAIGKLVGNNQVIHLVNFTNANSLQWRDTNGTEIKPVTINNPSFILTSSQTVKGIWMASPNLNGGASKTIAFTQSGSRVSFTLPSLQYWDMVVIQY